MKAKLTFKLPEEQGEFNRATNADELCSFVWDFQQYLRRVRKYDDLEGKTADELIDELWDEWHQKLDDENININELWGG